MPLNPNHPSILSWPIIIRGDWTMSVLFCCILCCLLFWDVFSLCILLYCWLGHQTCKNRRPYNLYCVGADVKPCSINQSLFVGISQVIGCEDCLWNDLDCVGCGVKLYSSRTSCSCWEWSFQYHVVIVMSWVYSVYRCVCFVPCHSVQIQCSCSPDIVFLCLSLTSQYIMLLCCVRHIH